MSARDSTGDEYQQSTTSTSAPRSQQPVTEEIRVSRASCRACQGERRLAITPASSVARPTRKRWLRLRASCVKTPSQAFPEKSIPAPSRSAAAIDFATPRFSLDSRIAALHSRRLEGLDDILVIAGASTSAGSSMISTSGFVSNARAIGEHRCSPRRAAAPPLRFSLPQPWGRSSYARSGRSQRFEPPRALKLILRFSSRQRREACVPCARNLFRASLSFSTARPRSSLPWNAIDPLRARAGLRRLRCTTSPCPCRCGR